MLIYNHKYELIGIDSEDLRMLGFTSLKEMFSECRDIADFFVKKPGYIHNFKNFKWIDFILHAEASIPKAIIQTSQRGFACDIVISPFFLADTPDEQAYAVTLAHIKPISGYDEADFVKEAPPSEIAKPAPVQEKAAAVKPPEPPKPAPAVESVPATPPSEPEPFETSDAAAFDPYDQGEDLLPAFNKPLDIEEDLFLSTEEMPAAAEMPAPEEEPAGFPSEEVKEQPPVPSQPMLGDYITPQEKDYIDNLTVSKDYVYDPQIAADELGLPVDLIQEFIGDFIQQSHDFHDELFEMAAKSDFDNVKILSHKLKGVAANLRIEDAFEILTIINSSNDQTEVQANLKHFYHMIAKLEGKEVPSFEEAPSSAPVLPPEEEAPAEIPAENEITADIFEAAPPPPQAEDDEDLYAFDIITEKPDSTPPAAAPASGKEEDDLYDFDLAVSSSPEESAETPSAPSDSQTQTAPESIEEHDLYAFDTSAPEEENDEFELPPMPEDEEIVLPPMDTEPFEEASSAEETPEPQEQLPAGEETHAVLHYDTAKVADELGLSFEIVHELQNDFVADAILAKSTLEDAVASSQSALWQESASRLKGITDNLRMNEISQTLHVLSHTDDTEEADKAIHKLYSYVDQL